MLEYVALGMLFNEVCTGYDLQKIIEDGVGNFYKASYGSLYPVLNRLTAKGHLIMTEQLQGARQKKLYQITEQGKEAFFEWLSTPMELGETTDNHLVKVYFFDRLPVNIRNHQLQAYELNNISYLKKLKEIEKHYTSLDNKECFYYKLATLYYGIRIVQDNIIWCRLIKEQAPLSDFIECQIKDGDTV